MQAKFIAVLAVLFMVAVLGAGQLAAEGRSVPHVDASTFAALVVQSDKPVLIQFDAEWCPYCKAMQPALQKLADKKSGDLAVFRLDTDAETDLTVQYQVQALPTLVIFQNGDEIARNIAAPQEKELFEWVESVIGEQVVHEE